jgi:sortase A
MNTKRVLYFFISILALSPFSAKAAVITSASITSAPEKPLYLYIPSIKLLSNIQGVGIDKKGNMDVPSGKTNDVGWYQYGVAPGNTGTAVIDAHNTAAFKKLDDVPVGEEIYIYTSKGRWLEFKVHAAKTYSMKTLKPETLFAKTNSKQINLITCAGTLLGNGEATHRLIVSAQLV